MNSAAFTINEWCASHGLSRATWYNLKRAGKAPRTYLAGTRERISHEADAEWVKAREAEAAARMIPDPDVSATHREIGRRGNQTRGRFMSRYRRAAAE
jgi:hypothetical protein